jgi:hypothetical protein
MFRVANCSTCDRVNSIATGAHVMFPPRESNDYLCLLYFTRLCFKSEASANLGEVGVSKKRELFVCVATNLVGRARRSDIVQLLGIDSKTERGLDARTQSLGVS